MHRSLWALLMFLPVALTPKSVYAQFLPAHNYPKDYFAWPVVAKRSLSANFGELRPNHYHMGWDCRTDQKQNMQVLAAADGYIAKIRIEPSGFGRSIYINHPNGLTTLYAHLNDFFPELETYVKEQQYKLKSWKIFIDLPENLFPVKKEMFIAYSGNTGASQGPHMHFEIRDTKTDKVLNPSLFGFPIPDATAPDIVRLAVYNRMISTYEQTPKIYSLKKINGIYTPSPALIIAKTNKISFGISASDRFTGSANHNGIFESILFENENPVIGFQIDSISYDETRDLNAHIDYKLRSSGGPYIQHLSRLPGYLNSIYHPANADGVISIDDDSIHSIRIEVKDADGNTSVIRFEVKRDPGFNAPAQIDKSAFFQQNEFHPAFINVYENDNILFYFPENCLYDSIRFQFKEIAQPIGYPVYQIHNAGIPMHGYFPILIKAATSLPDKMVMHRFANGRHDYMKAEATSNGKEKGWYKARFREFGNFQLMIDTIPPVINAIKFREGMNVSRSGRLAFTIVDNTEELLNFTATLDGKWLRFSNDKGRAFIYNFDEMCPPGEHELIISVEDCVGNRREKTYHFTR